MKKIFPILTLIIIVLIFFTGCNKDNINYKDSGKIKEFNLKNEYVDGSYYIFSNMFDDESKAPYMILNVKNNIITNINFNYIYKNSSLYVSENKNNEIGFYIKTLNTSVLQAQEKIKNSTSKNEDIFSDYNKLLDSGLNLAKSGNNKYIYVNLNTTYTASSVKYDTNGYNSTLRVSFESGKIDKVSYTKKDKSGNLITANNSYLKVFKDKYNVNYQKYIQNVVDLSIGQTKLYLSINKLDIDKEYNVLAKKINSKLIIFNHTKFKIFKNI